MGIQTMASQGNGKQSHSQPSTSLSRQNSLYRLTLDEVTSQLGDLGKPLGSMDLHELLQSIYTSEASLPLGKAVEETTLSASSSSLQRQASLSLAKALTGKSVDEVWREIQEGQKKRGVEDIVSVKEKNREPTMGETTLEDFLVQAGLFAEASPSPVVGSSNSIDVITPKSHPCYKLDFSPTSSIGALSDRLTPGRKRDDPDAYERTMDRRLRRKIKNRESAARSRARKQAYHSELVTKVSHLERENLMLEKEKEFDEKFPCDFSSGPKYQLRRTSSASF